MNRTAKLGLALVVLLALLIGGAVPGGAQAGICDVAPEPRLTIGGWAVVTDALTGTDGLSLREDARTGAPAITRLPAGMVLRVIDGPACNDGFYWWYLIDAENGVEGWAAEAFPGTYYLAPASAPPESGAPPPDAPTDVIFATNTPSDAPASAATPQPSPTIAASPGTPTLTATPAGSDVCPDDPAPSYITAGASARTADPFYPVRLRPSPEVSSIFQEAVYPDSIITVRGAAVCVEGQRWWPVAVSGRTGWTPEAANGRYLLIDPNNPPPDIVFADGLTEIPPELPAPDAAVAPTPRPTTPPDVVRRAAYTPDGGLIAVGDGAGVRLYDANTLALFATLGTGPVLDFVTFGGGLRAVVWTAAGIDLVSLPDGAVLHSLPNAPHDPAWAAAAPSGTWLVLGPTSDGQTATLWDLAAAAPPAVPPYWWPGWGVVFAAFSPDDAFALINDGVFTRGCSVAGTGCAFDIVRRDFTSSGIWGDVSWSGDGVWMAGFSNRFWLWDNNTLGVGFTLRSTLGTQRPRRVALNSDGTQGAIAAGALMELWNLAEGNYYTNRVVELPGAAQSLAYRPGSGEQLLVVAGAAVQVLDPASGTVLAQVE